MVFDVLRATSTLLTAFAHGARRIVPVSTIEEARRQHFIEGTDALLGGERAGVRIEGFNLGNSPREYTREAVEGRVIISTTTNGTVALRACAVAGETVAGALLNLDALAAHLLRRERPVEHLLLVCAGTGERFALEDGYAAGALLDRLLPGGAGAECDDASLAMWMLARSVTDPLRLLQAAENGRRLIQIGLGADVEWCARLGRWLYVATLGTGGLQGQVVDQLPMPVRAPACTW